MKYEFGSVIAAMATPFTPDGDLDLDGAQRLAAFLLDHGNDALVVCGTTGEVPSLSDAEKVDLWRVTKEVAGERKVIAGATNNSTWHSLKLVESATEAGVDGILAVAPYYNRPPQEGLYQHFSALLQESVLPFILYDVPARTARKVSTDVIIRLVEENDNLVGLKDAAGDVPETAALIESVRDSFWVLSGDDSLTLPLLAVGARGVVSVASHWAGPLFNAMVGAFAAGEVTQARQINAALLPSFAFESQGSAPNPIPLKAVLEVLRLSSSQCRLPLPSPEAALFNGARSLIEQLVAASNKLGIHLDEHWNL